NVRILRAVMEDSLQSLSLSHTHTHTHTHINLSLSPSATLSLSLVFFSFLFPYFFIPPSPSFFLSVPLSWAASMVPSLALSVFISEGPSFSVDWQYLLLRPL